MDEPQRTCIDSHGLQHNVSELATRCRVVYAVLLKDGVQINRIHQAPEIAYYSSSSATAAIIRSVGTIVSGIVTSGEVLPRCHRIGSFGHLDRDQLEHKLCVEQAAVNVAIDLTENE